MAAVLGLGVRFVVVIPGLAGCRRPVGVEYHESA